MSDIKISVVVPVYNVEKYLEQCLNSIINQTFKDIEIICVNNGSTNESLTVLNHFAQPDKRFRVIHQGSKVSVRRVTWACWRHEGNAWG